MTTITSQTKLTVKDVIFIVSLVGGLVGMYWRMESNVGHLLERQTEMLVEIKTLRESVNELSKLAAAHDALISRGVK